MKYYTIGQFSKLVGKSMLTILKKSELNWLNGVSNNMAKQAVKDACNAYKKFFKG